MVSFRRKFFIRMKDVKNYILTDYNGTKWAILNAPFFRCFAFPHHFSLQMVNLNVLFSATAQFSCRKSYAYTIPMNWLITSISNDHLCEYGRYYTKWSTLSYICGMLCVSNRTSLRQSPIQQIIPTFTLAH